MPSVSQPSAKFVRLSHLRRLRGRQQVAAVCYRERNSEIQFLLVQTRGSGRWTFPKGSTEPGLTHAQAAALEAFEEAGVHGRIEEAAFTSYALRKPRSRKADSTKQTLVSVHLCEVSRLEAPQEFDRNPTWFSAEKAKDSLRLERDAEYGRDLARVVDRAVARIQRLRSAAEAISQPRQEDALRRAQLIECAWRVVENERSPIAGGKGRRQFLN